MTIGEKIKAARKEKGLTQEALGEMLGIQKSAVAKYENGRVVNIKLDTLRRISEILGIKASELICDPLWDPRFPNIDISKKGNTTLFVAENGEIRGPHAEVTVLEITDNSMADDRILAGDVVLIRKQSIVNNGEIAAAKIDGGETVLRRFFYYTEEDKLVLMSADRSLAPAVFVGEEIDRVEIIGKAIAFQSRIN